MCWDTCTGAYISTAIIALCLLFYDWRLMIACLWGVPVAFGLLFGSRKIAAQNSEVTKKSRPSGLRRHPGGVGECPGDTGCQPGGAVSGRSL